MSPRQARSLCLSLSLSLSLSLAPLNNEGSQKWCKRLGTECIVLLKHFRCYFFEIAQKQRIRNFIIVKHHILLPRGVPREGPLRLDLNTKCQYKKKKIDREIERER